MRFAPSSTTSGGAESRSEGIRDLVALWGVHVAETPVCRGHCAPLDFLDAWVFDRPSLSLVHGPRGGGKSFLAAMATHLNSIQYDRHGTRILGGSLAQSQQIYDALLEFDHARKGRSPFTTITRQQARYSNGSDVSILAASRTSVRGPHVASLCLDEIDEIEADIREAATGMCMARNGVSASIAMTSTWHNVGGPMAELIEKGERGDFPLYRFCTFDVLERCPESRSGAFVGGADLYEHCPACPIVRWCHAERDRNGDVPLAKIADGHYAIDSLIQKVKVNSLRAFESDYLCRGPRADGVWFREFDESANVSIDAEYDPNLPVHYAIDSGNHVGAVLFQVHATPGRRRVTVFDDYSSEGVKATAVAPILKATVAGRMGTKFRVSTDRSGRARNPFGPAMAEEYEAAGLTGDRGILEDWDQSSGSVADTLSFVEGLVLAADGSRSLLIHPRCKHLISAMKSYRRAKLAGQWMDYPKDPQHPAEELIDSLRCGLRMEFPFTPPRQFGAIPASQLSDSRW